MRYQQYNNQSNFLWIGILLFFVFGGFKFPLSLNSNHICFWVSVIAVTVNFLLFLKKYLSFQK